MSAQRLCSVVLTLGLVFACVSETRATIVADPNLLVGYSHEDWIDDAFSGVTLSATARNWASLGSYSHYYYLTGHVVLHDPTSSDPLLGWELKTVYAPWGVPPEIIGTSSWDDWGGHYHQHLFSADSVILRVDLDSPTNTVWADISNPGNSSNNDIQITAYDENDVELGYQYGNIEGSTITRVQYAQPTTDIKYFTVDRVGGYWGYPIHAVGAAIPEPSTLALLGTLTIAAGWWRRRRAA